MEDTMLRHFLFVTKALGLSIEPEALSIMRAGREDCSIFVLIPKLCLCLVAVRLRVSWLMSRLAEGNHKCD